MRNKRINLLWWSLELLELVQKMQHEALYLYRDFISYLLLEKKLDTNWKPPSYLLLRFLYTWWDSVRKTIPSQKEGVYCVWYRSYPLKTISVLGIRLRKLFSVFCWFLPLHIQLKWARSDFIFENKLLLFESNSRNPRNRCSIPGGDKKMFLICSPEVGLEV
jgi:hypothetical protein